MQITTLQSETIMFCHFNQLIINGPNLYDIFLGAVHIWVSFPRTIICPDLCPFFLFGNLL